MKGFNILGDGEEILSLALTFVVKPAKRDVMLAPSQMSSHCETGKA
jgi:hypothetical protein